AVGGAGIRPKELAFISPHGSGTRMGDRVELFAIAELLEGDRAAVPISGLKPYTGHMGAASDLAEVALSLTALDHGLAPATLNFRAVEAGLEGGDVATAPRPVGGRPVLSMCPGPRGQALPLLVSPRPPSHGPRTP